MKRWNIVVFSGLATAEKFCLFEAIWS